MLIDEAVIAKLKRLIPLAPLHQPHNIAGIEAAIEAFPSIAAGRLLRHRLPSQPSVRRRHLRAAALLLRRRRPPLRLPRPLLRVHRAQAEGDRAADRARGRGHRAISATAPRCARSTTAASIASTMGFTALDGLPMGTRCGQLDPGVLLYLMAEKKMGAAEISDLLYKNSGLKGMSGISQDMRELEASDSPARARRHRLFRRPHPPRARRPGGDRRRRRSHRLHRRHRRALLARPRSGPHRNGVDGRPSRRRSEPRRGSRSSAPSHSPTIVFVIPTDEERMIAEHTIATAGVGGQQPRNASG